MLFLCSFLFFLVHVASSFKYLSISFGKYAAQSTKVCAFSMYPSTTQVFENNKDAAKLFSSGDHILALETLIDKSMHSKLTKQDIDIASACAWALRSPEKSLLFLQMAKDSHILVSKYAMSLAMRSFCYAEKYDFIRLVLEELFPHSSSGNNVFEPSERLKWQCRVLVEGNESSNALKLIRVGSSSIPVYSALSTVIQTAAKLNQHPVTLNAYRLLINISSTNNSNMLSEVTAYDLRAVVKSARAKSAHSVLLEAFDKWVLLPPNSEVLISTVHLNQAVTAALALQDRTRAANYLTVTLPKLGLQGDDYTKALFVRLRPDALVPSNGSVVPPVMSDLLGNTVTNFRGTDRMEHQLATLLSSLESRGVADEREVTSLLVRLTKEGNVGAFESVVESLRTAGFLPNLFHYTVMARAYGKARRGLDSLRCLREAQARGLQPDLPLYATVIDALASNTSVLPDPDGSSAGSSLSLELLDEALAAAASVAENAAPDSDIVLKSSLRTLFNSAMKPFGRQGDVAATEAIIARMNASGIAADNITLATRLRAYAASGRVSQCEAMLLAAMQRGDRPNGQVAAVAIQALSSASRHEDGWRLFLHHGLSSGYIKRGEADRGTFFFVLPNQSELLPYDSSHKAAQFSPGSSSTSGASGPPASIGWRQKTDSLFVRDALSEAMYCCAKGRLSVEAKALMKAVLAAGVQPDSFLLSLFNRACDEGQRRPRFAGGDGFR